MKYCCNVATRHGSCYQEFKKGKYDGKHWCEDSLLLYDDLIDELGLYKVLIKAIPTYERWGITEVKHHTWNQLVREARKAGGEIKEVIDEINDWAQETFIITVAAAVDISNMFHDAYLCWDNL